MTGLLAMMPAGQLARAALGLFAGAVLASLWLPMLRLSALALAEGRPGRALALGLGRIVAAGGLFVALVPLGAAPMLFALASFTVACRMVLSRVSQV